MFHISILVLILCHQVVFSTSYECSPIAIKGEKCTITRRVSPNSLIWNKDGTSILSSTYQATNTCLPSAPNTEYATYCLRDPSNYIFILELINPENHAGSTFSDGASGLTTTINLMVPDSPNITINSINPITEDMFIVSVRVSCCKPQPTKFIWNFNASKSTIPYTIESTQTSTDNTGCTSSLLNRESSRSVNLNDWDPEITNTDGDIDISVGVKFGEGKTVNSSPVTVQYISQGTTSVSPETTTVVPPECYCYCLILLIIKVVLVVVAIILVIVHWSRKEAKTEGNMYWVINVGFILDGPVCFVLSIIQILYLKHIIACSRCMDRPGYNAAIAFVVFGFIVFIVCIGLFVIRLKQRGQSKKKPLGTEMLPDPEKKDNGARPLPKPKTPKDQL